MKLDIKEESIIVAQLYHQDCSIRQIAKELLLSASTVQRRLALSGHKARTSDEGVKLASEQGRLNAPRINRHALRRNEKGQFKK